MWNDGKGSVGRKWWQLFEWVLHSELCYWFKLSTALYTPPDILRNVVSFKVQQVTFFVSHKKRKIYFEESHGLGMKLLCSRTLLYLLSGEQTVAGLGVVFGILWTQMLRGGRVLVMFWVVLITRCRAFLSWVVHTPCQFVMFPVRMLSVAPL